MPHATLSKPCVPGHAAGVTRDGAVDFSDNNAAQTALSIVYAGFVHEPAVGGTLALARFRLYDGELGRWLSRDPLRALSDDDA